MNNENRLNICVIGAGYVGLAQALFLAKYHNVFLYDINKDKLDLIAKGISPIKDKDIEEYLKRDDINLKVDSDFNHAVAHKDVVLIATPTDYDDVNNKFDTSSVETCISKTIRANYQALIVIKSTVNIGFTKDMINKYHFKNILFVPEFLKEGTALHDAIHPTRIIIGENEGANTDLFLTMIEDGIKDTEVEIMSNLEAEAAKLFANSYLAMRVAFFNELDTYAESMNLDSKKIIKGVCDDPRIGDFYNNPSFGYGGYCLPKDSKQLKSSFGTIPNETISSIVSSNQTRKEYIANQIESKIKNIENPIIGIYRLTMKTGSDNFRQSSVLDVMRLLNNKGYKIIIYEPTINENALEGIKIIKDLSTFKNSASIIIANRYDTVLNDVKNKVYTRDIYNRD